MEKRMIWYDDEIVNEQQTSEPTESNEAPSSDSNTGVDGDVGAFDDSEDVVVSEISRDDEGITDIEGDVGPLDNPEEVIDISDIHRDDEPVTPPGETELFGDDFPLEPTDILEPTGGIEPTDPIQPTDILEPTGGIEPTDPIQPTDIPTEDTPPAPIDPTIPETEPETESEPEIVTEPETVIETVVEPEPVTEPEIVEDTTPEASTDEEGEDIVPTEVPIPTKEEPAPPKPTYDPKPTYEPEPTVIPAPEPIVREESEHHEEIISGSYDGPSLVAKRQNSRGETVMLYQNPDGSMTINNGQFSAVCGTDGKYYTFDQQQQKTIVLDDKRMTQMFGDVRNFGTTLYSQSAVKQNMATTTVPAKQHVELDNAHAGTNYDALEGLKKKFGTEFTQYDRLADEVMAGKYGDGPDRKEALGEKAGVVQAIVNYKSHEGTKKEVVDAFCEAFTNTTNEYVERKKSLRQHLLDSECAPEHQEIVKEIARVNNKIALREEMLKHEFPVLAEAARRTDYESSLSDEVNIELS